MDVVYYTLSILACARDRDPNIYKVPIFDSCTRCLGSPGIITTAYPVATQHPGNRCMDDLTTERNFHLKATWVIDVLALFI